MLTAPKMNGWKLVMNHLHYREVFPHRWIKALHVLCVVDPSVCFISHLFWYNWLTTGSRLKQGVIARPRRRLLCRPVCVFLSDTNHWWHWQCATCSGEMMEGLIQMPLGQQCLPQLLSHLSCSLWKGSHSWLPTLSCPSVHERAPSSLMFVLNSTT